MTTFIEGQPFTIAYDHQTPLTFAIETRIHNRPGRCQVFQGTLDNHPVAIKEILHKKSPETAQFEYEVMRHLSHPYIVKARTWGVDHGTGYLVSEYVPQGSLADYCIPNEGLLNAEFRFDGPRAARIATQVAIALDYMHARGVIHRDIKPSNILMLDKEGNCKITDFSSAQINGEQSPHLELGTPQYVAPEQVHGEAQSPQTDMFAYGIVLFEMLTGRIPFVRDRVFYGGDTQFVAPPEDCCDEIDTLIIPTSSQTIPVGGLSMHIMRWRGSTNHTDSRTRKINHYNDQMENLHGITSAGLEHFTKKQIAKLNATLTRALQNLPVKRPKNTLSIAFQFCEALEQSDIFEAVLRENNMLQPISRPSVLLRVAKAIQQI